MHSIDSEPEKFKHVTWKSPESIDALEGYALAVCVRLYASRNKETGEYRFIGDRALEPPSVLTPEVADFISAVYAHIVERIRSDQNIKSESDVMGLISCADMDEYKEWAENGKDKIKSMRERLRRLELTKTREGFVCYGP